MSFVQLLKIVEKNAFWNLSENLKNMYGMFSEISHSSKTEPFALLAEKIDNLFN